MKFAPTSPQIVSHQSQSYHEDVHGDDRKVSEKQATENGKVKKFLFNLHFGFFSGGNRNER